MTSEIEPLTERLRARADYKPSAFDMQPMPRLGGGDAALLREAASALEQARVSLRPRLRSIVNGMDYMDDAEIVEKLNGLTRDESSTEGGAGEDALKMLRAPSNDYDVEQYRCIVRRLLDELSPSPTEQEGERVVPYSVCECGHRYDHHRSYGPTSGCYRCTCEQYRPAPDSKQEGGA